ADFPVARYNSNGTSLDLGFGDGLTNAGTVVTNFGDIEGAYAVAIDAAGRIVVVGDTTADGGDFDFAIARYTSQGIPDVTFNGIGRQIVGFDSDFDNARAVAI